MNGRRLLLTAMFLLAGVDLCAQSFTIATTPRRQIQMGGDVVYSVSATATGGFTASIYLRASSPTLPGATFTFAPKLLNYPYQESATLTVMLTGVKAGGDHRIIIEGYNGPLVVRDTCIVTITDHPAWRVFNTSNSGLPSDPISAIGIDPFDVGWLGTDVGFVRFDGGTAWSVSPLLQQALPIYSIEADSNNGIWFGTQDGLLEIRAGNYWWHFIPGVAFGHRGFYGVAATRDSTVIWTVSPQYLSKFDGTTWTNYDPDNSPIIAYGSKVVVDKNNAVWVLDEIRGIDRFDGTYWTHLDPDDIGLGLRLTDLAVDSNGVVWVAGREGVARLDGVQGTVYRRTSSGFPGPSPRSITFDPSGTMWIAENYSGHGEEEGGLGRYDGTNWWFYTIGNSGLPSNNVTAVKAAKNMTIWVGTDKGLVLLDGKAPASTLLSADPIAGMKPMLEQLASVAPNPVSGKAQIRLSIPAAEHVRIGLHNTLGQEVMVLVDRMLVAGDQQLSVDLSGLSAATYFVRLSAGGLIETRPIIVAR